MASNATNATPGRMARATHWLFRSRRHVAISLAADASLALFGLPIWMHVTLSFVIHLVVAAID